MNKIILLMLLLSGIAQAEPDTFAASDPNTAAVVAARAKLVQAQQALEQGKQVRLGNERNYAKYLERIQGLQNNVDQAQKELDTLSASH